MQAVLPGGFPFHQFNIYCKNVCDDDIFHVTFEQKNVGSSVEYIQILHNIQSNMYIDCLFVFHIQLCAVTLPSLSYINDLFINLFIYLFIYLFIIYFFIYFLFIYLFIHSFIYLFIMLALQQHSIYLQNYYCL